MDSTIDLLYVRPAYSVRIRKIKSHLSLAGMLLILFNNTWSVACEGKKISEINVGDGLIPDTGLKKESAQKRIATYPKVPAQLFQKAGRYNTREL